jgi:hypothetical protein
MATLYERIGHIGYVQGDPSTGHMAPSDVAAVFRYIEFDVGTAAEAYSHYNLDAGQQAEWDTLYATVVGNQTTKLLRIATIEHYLTMWQDRFPGFTTEAEVKTRLGV